MDEAIEHARALLEALGLDKEADPELDRTPERVARLLSELFSELGTEAPDISVFDSPTESADPVVVAALPFQSMCVHHLTPIFGTIDIAYVPGQKMAGFGSFVRIVEWASRRPQVQERLVETIAEQIQAALEPTGLLVRCRARQMCVEMRGARKKAVFVSSSSRGELQSGHARADVMRQIVSAEEAI